MTDGPRSDADDFPRGFEPTEDYEQEDEIELVDEDDVFDSPRPARNAFDQIGLRLGDEMAFFTARQIRTLKETGKINDNSPVWLGGDKVRLGQIWDQLERRLDNGRPARRQKTEETPPGAFKRAGLLIDGEMKYYTPRELYDLVKRGFVRGATPVYLGDVQYSGRDFWDQLDQTPIPKYFVVPERTQSPVLLYFSIGFILSVVVVAALVLILGKQSDVAPEPEPATPPVVVEPEKTEPETPEPEKVESESTEPEPTQSETPEPETSKTEPNEPERTKSESEKPEPPKTEPTTPEPVEPEPTRPATTEPEPYAPERSESEVETPEPTKTEPTPTTSEPPKPEKAPDATSNEERSPSSPEPEASTRPETGGWLDAPFNPNVAKIPSDFRGHNFRAVRDALLRPEFRRPERGANESDYDYDARLGAAEFRAERTTLFGTVSPTSRLAFVLPNLAMVRADPERYRGSEYVTTQYATATKTLTVSKSLGIFSVSFFDGRHIAPFLLSGGSYGLALESPSEFGFRWANSDSYHWKVAGIPEKTYENMKDTICVLCVVVVDYQGLDDVGLLGASGNYALYSREAEFWLYDAASGEILGKFSFDDTLEETPHEYRFGRVSPGVVAHKINKRQR